MDIILLSRYRDMIAQFRLKVNSEYVIINKYILLIYWSDIL